MKEFRAAVFDMSPIKASGSDGLPALFYPKFWPVMGDKVTCACLGVLNDGHSLEEVNCTLIALIPKVKRVERMFELRPISLCNVLYIIVAKALTNRFRGVLSEIISNTGNAIIPGRLILDNAIVGFKCVHALRRRKKGKPSVLALKLDMSKAYDRVEWRFISGMMGRMGFSDSWIRRIMGCVSTMSYSFLVNSVVAGALKPMRGLRQEDPLSPYLFLICVEGLSRLIFQEERLGNIGFHCSRGGPKITHLLFADHSMMFTRASQRDCRAISRVLELYAFASGQAINFQKSAICVSSGVNHGRADSLARLLNVELVWCHEHYLGLPSFAEKNSVPTSSGARMRRRRKFIGALRKSCVGVRTREASCGSSASFLWRSFVLGKELLEACSRLRIGNGCSVSINSDRWIPRPSTFKVNSPPVLSNDAKVYELKLPIGGWNVDHVRQSLSANEAALILSIPSSYSMHADSLMWHYDNLGSFSAMSAYHLGCELLSNPSPSGLSSSEAWWKFLWCLKIPSKIKLFVLRACNDWLPSMVNLGRRKVHVEGTCQLCNRRPEIALHAIWCCPTLKQIRVVAIL
ncbi:hypothetical protein Dsin_009249 [Dipteronia sinensis]|uniref:Reverse transcriptase domain-containing protein n=1 Tax=Dipteronia sinensis TaxID=43782 RepID=A0AAE0ARI1_9ROSI|nr:hypothetical protein Dsin_009249 [Dipteronia sinensis]